MLALPRLAISGTGIRTLQYLSDLCATSTTSLEEVKIRYHLFRRFRVSSLPHGLRHHRLNRNMQLFNRVQAVPHLGQNLVLLQQTTSGLPKRKTGKRR